MYILSVFLHIFFASFWIGGMLFLPLVLLPGIKNHPDRVELLYQTGLKLRFFGWIALAGLLVTGILNAYLRGFTINWAFFTEVPYGKTVFIKLVLFAVIIGVMFFHDLMIGKKAIEEMKMERNGLKVVARWSGRVSLILALTAVYFGIVLSRGLI